MTKEEQLYNLLCDLMFHSRQAIQAYQARKQLDDEFGGMGVNILQESAARYYGTMERNLPKSLKKAEEFLDNNPPPWSKTHKKPFPLPFSTTIDQIANIPKIVIEMIINHVPKTLVEKAALIALKDQGVYDLIEMWWEEDSKLEKDAIIKDLEKSINDYEDNGT